MASLQQHMEDCVKFLGVPHREVHEWIDAFAARVGPSHRRVRHNREGIAEARSLFGEEGARAAAIHILRDCRNLPFLVDYTSGRVDALGLQRTWPVTAYIRYPEPDFEELVMTELYGPSGVVLWAFADEAAFALMASVSRFTLDEVRERAQVWSDAVETRSRLPPLEHHDNVHSIVSASVNSYLNEIGATPLFARIRQQMPQSTFELIDLDNLITPLVYIDKEHVEELKAELQGDDEDATVRFSIPLVISSKVKAVMNPLMNSVSFISPQKTLAVSPVQVRQTPEGVEVRFMVSNSFSAIVVGKIGSRYYLRNGIHRAYLLRSLGIKSAPCLLVQEEAPPPITIQAYPTFTPEVLGRERPPLLKDYFDPKLSIEIPLQRTQKVIKISPDESILPVD
ncbi:MAG: hypothetical protein WB622_01235 [Acidobacteriaceae bacterium]